MRLIDADALMEELKENHDNIMQDPEVKASVKWREAVVFHSTSQTIRQSHTVDAVEVVHGRTEVIEPFGVTLTARCCLCGAAMGNLDNYCPNCGAKMDGERKDND